MTLEFAEWKCTPELKCSICGTPTDWACPYCKIDLHTDVFVCEKPECRVAHNKVCSYPPKTVKSLTSGQLTKMTINGIKPTKEQILEMYGDRDNWLQIYHDGRNYWAWDGPMIVGYEAALLPRNDEDEIQQLKDKIEWFERTFDEELEALRDEGLI